MADPLAELAARLDAVRAGRIAIDAAERELGREAFELLRRDPIRSTRGALPPKPVPRILGLLRCCDISRISKTRTGGSRRRSTAAWRWRWSMRFGRSAFDTAGC